jgi:hypothetical protein
MGPNPIPVFISGIEAPSFAIPAGIIMNTAAPSLTITATPIRQLFLRFL